MSRIVLDTNCLIQCISPRSRYHLLWKSLESGEHELCLSNEMIEEYVEILQRFIGYEATEYVVKTILNSAFTRRFEIFYKFNLIRDDKDDNKFVDCAIAANAKCIVSNDKHFNVLKNIDFPHVEVLDIETFVKMFCSKTE